MSVTPDVHYSDYTELAAEPEKCCANCVKYKPKNDKMGICYEYEVLPEAGCKFFEAKLK